jgi:GT2 family glycosyltransferase
MTNASKHHAVTAILVNYFGHADIALAVASLHADAPALDIIVIDNSDDAQEAAALQAALSFAASVTIATAPRNLGFGQACNWAASMRPDAAFYWLVNPDVRVLPGCLAALLGTMNAHPSLGAVAPLQFLDEAQTCLFSPSWRPTAIGMWASEVAQRQPRAWQRHTAAVCAESRRVLQLKQQAEQGRTTPLLQRALSGAIVLLRRQALEQIGGMFDPRYFMYYEDSDLCLRLRRGGWGMALAPQARALHLWTMGGHKGS